MTSSATDSRTQEHIELTETYAAHNYHPLPVVLASGEGAWVTDVDGKRYLDCLAGYSALNFGHGHPRLLARMHEQIDKLTLTSRAFYNDQLGPFAKALAGLTGKDLILPMNSGAEAVETAIKVSRRWGYEVKGVEEAQASIIVMEGNFHDDDRGLRLLDALHLVAPPAADLDGRLDGLGAGVHRQDEVLAGQAGERLRERPELVVVERPA